MDLVSSTARPSRELKSSSLDKAPSHSKVPQYWAHRRGLESEEIVKVYYLHRGYILLGQRVQTPFAEVDLLFQTPERYILMVEVKTANLDDFHFFRVSRRQKERQARALHYLAETKNCLVEVHWAFVTKTGELTVIEDISG